MKEIIVNNNTYLFAELPFDAKNIRSSNCYVWGDNSIFKQVIYYVLSEKNKEIFISTTKDITEEECKK